MPEIETSLEPIVNSIKTVQEKAEEYLPKMRNGSARAVARLKEQYDKIVDAASKYDGLPNEDMDLLIADVSDTLSSSKEAYDVWNKWRTEMTAPMDEFKKLSMEYEKTVAYDGKTDNYYTKIRHQLVLIENKKIAKKKEEEIIAQKKKELENYKVDLMTQVKKNLTQMVISRVSQVDAGSKAYFDKSDLDNFDARADVFQSNKPKLKVEDYDACFKIISSDKKLSQQEQSDLFDSVTKEEPFDKWNEAVIESITPTLNAWRAKIPMLKQQLIDLQNARSEQERLKLQEEQDRLAQEEQIRKDIALKEVQANANREIDNAAQMDKMNNEFVAQATTQELGETAPVKYVYVVKDEKLVVKALCAAVYHTVINPKFDGIYKLDKAGKKIIDPETNKSKLIDQVDWWFKFVAANCDVDLEGMELLEVAKVSIKK